MTPTRRHLIMLLMVVLLGSWLLPGTAHQDPCHRRHSCPADHGSYVCGDRGHCEQCSDNQYCLAGKTRVASAPTPTPAPPGASRSTTTQAHPDALPSAVTACFTPGGNCTETIVQALGDAKRTILVQAYSFTSTPTAKAWLDTQTRGVQVQVILDKSQRTAKYSSADFLAN